MKSRMTLAHAAAAAGLAACASDERRITRSDDRTIARTPSSRIPGDTAQGASQPADHGSLAAYDFSRRADLQRVLNGRIETVSREIASLRASAAAGSECERRMRYLEAVRDSASESVAKLHETKAEDWTSQRSAAEDQVVGLERYLANERSTCTASRQSP